jgi:hypothetical protein
MPFDYAVYGLVLQANHPLPGLKLNESRLPTDLNFEEIESAVTAYEEIAVQDRNMISDGSISSIQRIWSVPKVDGQGIQLFYRSPTPGAADFFVDSQARKVECRRSAPATLQDVTTLLLGTVLNYVLRARGIVCLHACVINIGSKAVAVIGDKGTGKSTTAAAFARAGYPILSDDMGAISAQESGWLVHPGYPRLRLWRSTLEALQMPCSGLTPVLTPMDKYYFDLSSASDHGPWLFQATPLPLTAIYLISRDTELTEPVVEPLSGIEKMTTLVTHTSSHFAPLNQNQRSAEFQALSRMGSTVPLSRVRYPSGIERLPELMSTIVGDVEKRDA